MKVLSKPYRVTLSAPGATNVTLPSVSTFQSARERAKKAALAQSKKTFSANASVERFVSSGNIWDEILSIYAENGAITREDDLR